MSSARRPEGARPHVVVGVDGSAASVAAVRYAAAEAARSGARVEVVHVVPDLVPGRALSATDELALAGRRVLRSVLRRAGLATGDVAVRTHLQRGGVVPTLVRAADGAQALVVGSDRRPASLRLLTGNVSTGVAARSRAPVVSVPETWQPGHTGTGLLVGVKHADRSEALMCAAFGLAVEWGSPLQVVRAWRGSGSDEAAARRPDRHEREDDVRHELEGLLAPWRRRHPAVEVDVTVVEDQAACALVTASEHADELLIHRRSHGFPAGTHLGRTARTVLLYAHCPVRVVPDTWLAHTFDLELEAAGAPLT